MKTVVIKSGGSIIDKLSEPFFHSLKELQNNGYKIVMVHGGGPQINHMLAAMKIEPQFVNGLRKTTEETMKIVEMTLAGQTNRQFVEALTNHGFNAIGLQGSDAQLLQGDYLDKENLGYVGEIYQVNTAILSFFLEKNIIPVITPVAISKDGKKLNVNADYAAAAVAKALPSEYCLFVTDVDGIIINGELIESMAAHRAAAYIKNGQIYGGMIPKVQSALHALEKGIKCVTIVSGKKAFFKNGRLYGTKILKEERVLL